MLHHYGRCFPKIYATPIQPLKSRRDDDNRRTYLDLIRDDLEENATLDNLPVVGTTNSKNTEPAVKDTQTQTDLQENDQQPMLHSSRTVQESQSKGSEHPTQTNLLKGFNPKKCFTPEEDIRILGAIETHRIKNGANINMKIDWHVIKMTANLTQLPSQIKLRYWKIKENRNKPTADFQQTPQYEPVQRLLNSLKIERISAALNIATQREFLDGSFFENLPAKIGTLENWEDVKQFYHNNYRKIALKLDKEAQDRLFLHPFLKHENDYDDFDASWDLGAVYKSQRKKREQMNQKIKSDQLIESRVSSKGACKRPNIAKEVEIISKYSRQSKPGSSKKELEWIALLTFLSKTDVYPFLDELRFWDNVLRQLETTTGKTGHELKEDFYTHIVPRRNDKDWIRIPKLKLQPTTQISKVVIFHEINKTGLVDESIQLLISDEILSEEISLEAWFETFALEISKRDHLFFMSNESEFKVVKESVRVRIISSLKIGH